MIGKLFRAVTGKDPFGRKRAYFDYASITPVDKRVLSHMNQAARQYPANPSSLYIEGVAAQKALEAARKEIADALEVHADEIIFTSGGTEANNLAIVSVVESLWSAAERSFSGMIGAKVDHETIEVTLKPHIVISAIEHPSVKEVAEHLKKRGVEVTVVPVEENGIISAKNIKAALRAQTVLVSVMYVNNEIGTVQPLAEIAKALRSYKKSLGRDNHAWPYFHTDACQAACYESLRVPSLGIDMMTLDSSKFYGPRSSGILYAKRAIKIIQQIHGGDQEKGKRAGTEDVVKAIGFARALKIARDEMQKEIPRLMQMRDGFIDWTLKNIKGARLNGAWAPGTVTERAPNNINICIPGRDAEYMVLQLDAKGFAISSVTSCQNLREDSYSYVIAALGDTCEDHQKKKNYRDCAQSSLRITLGRFTTAKQIERLKKSLLEITSQ